MESELLGIKSYNSSQWDSALSSVQFSSFFHTSTWLNSLDTLEIFDNVCMIFEFPQGNVLFPLFKAKKGLFRYYLSVPYGYGGVISQFNITDKIILKIMNHVLKPLTVKLRIKLSPFDTTEYPEHYNAMNNYTHILRLDSSYEDIWKKKYSKKCRNIIRKARKNDLTVFEEKNTKEAIDKYMKLRNKCEQRWQNEKLLQKSFFSALLNADKNGKICLFFAYYKEIPISGMINFYYNKEVITWRQVSDSNYWKYAPNNFLYDWAIKDAIEKKFLYYNFGASLTQSLTHFKESFGADKVETKVYFKENLLGKIARKLNLVL